MNQNNRKGFYIYLVMLMAVVFLAMSWFNANTAQRGVEYDGIVSQFLNDQVAEYQLDFNTRNLTYILRADKEAAEASGTEPRVYTTQVPDINLFISDVHQH